MSDAEESPRNVKHFKKENGNNLPYANPPPPPEINQAAHEDLIDNTMISKHRLFNILIKIVEKVQTETQVDQVDSDNENGTVKELDEDFENDLCDLWDMTVKKEVCRVLVEYNCIDIFEQYIFHAYGKYPRAIEIIIGILTNLCLQDENGDLIKIILKNYKELISLFSTQILFDLNDVQTLIQLLRLMNVLLTHEKDSEVRLLVIDLFKIHVNAEQLLNTINFIFDQSLNVALHENICEFLTNLYDIDTGLVDKYPISVQSLLNSLNTRFDNISRHTQTTALEIETPLIHQTPNQYNRSVSNIDLSITNQLFKNYFAILQSFSTCDTGVLMLCQALGGLEKCFKIYLNEFLQNFNEWELLTNRDFDEVSLKNSNYLLSIINCLVKNLGTIDLNGFLVNNEELFQNLLSLIRIYVNFYEKNEGEDGDSDDMMKIFFVYLNELVGFFKTFKKIDYLNNFVESLKDLKSFKI